MKLNYLVLSTQSPKGVKQQRVGGRGGGGEFNKVLPVYGLASAASKLQLLTFLYTIFHRQGTPCIYLPLKNGTPFTLLSF